jgi:hypothetical protein
MEQQIALFNLYLQDPDNIKDKRQRLYFEKVILNIQKSIGKRFFGLLNRKLPLNEITSYYACELLFNKLSSLLNEKNYHLIRDSLSYSSDVDSLFGVFVNEDTYVIILVNKKGDTYQLEVSFKKNFSSKNYSLNDIKKNLDKFVSKQGIKNPLVYHKELSPTSFLQEFERRLKLYSWVNLTILMPKESGFSRFMKTFED